MPAREREPPFHATLSFRPIHLPKEHSVVMTQLEAARQGTITDEMRFVAQHGG
jgi:hypothetical protein